MRRTTFSLASLGSGDDSTPRRHPIWVSRTIFKKVKSQVKYPGKKVKYVRYGLRYRELFCWEGRFDA